MQKVGRVLSLLSCIAAVGMALFGLPFVAHAEVIVLTVEQAAAVRQAVLRRLKDPESARFGAMVASPDDLVEIMVCGWVNAKNSYGGYTGEVPYYAVYSTKTGFAVAGAIAGTPFEYSAMIDVCRNNRAPLQ